MRIFIPGIIFVCTTHVIFPQNSGVEVKTIEEVIEGIDELLSGVDEIFGSRSRFGIKSLGFYETET